MTEESKTPCETCGDSTPFSGAVRCTNCREVESRLEKYLQSPSGQKWARNKMPLFDDWVDGFPDSRDFNTVLLVYEVKVEWIDTIVDEYGIKYPPEYRVGWLLSWKNGTMHIGDTTETIARKAAALFVSLWQRGVSASFANKLIDGFIVYLERQEGITKGIIATVKSGEALKNIFNFTLAELLLNRINSFETLDLKPAIKSASPSANCRRNNMGWANGN